MVVKNNFFVFAVRNLGVESEKNFPPEDNYPPIKPNAMNLRETRPVIAEFPPQKE